MARQVTVNKLDDFDGTPATDTFELTVDGMIHTIDLNRRHAAELRAMLKPYLAHAFDTRKADHKPDAIPKAQRKPRKPRKPPAGGATSINLPDQGLIRAWARANGHDVKPTGNVKRALRDAYYASLKHTA